MSAAIDTVSVHVRTLSRLHQFLIFSAVVLGWPRSSEAAGNGTWRLDFPPWGEPGGITVGGPRLSVPILGPFTKHSCFPSRYLAMRIATSHVNRRDQTLCPAIGNLRHKFELEYELFDTAKSETTAATTAFRKTSAKVILGPNSSGPSKAVSFLLRLLGIPLVSWAATSPSLSDKATYPNFWRTAPSEMAAIRGCTALLKAFGYERFLVIHTDNTFDANLASAIRDEGLSANMTPTFFHFPAEAVEETTVMQYQLDSMRATYCRVVVAFGEASVLFELWRQADLKNMLRSGGWLWMTAGRNIADFQGKPLFVGTFNVVGNSQGPSFPSFRRLWQEDMQRTQRPEFDSMPLCHNDHICAGREDFLWKEGVHDVSLSCETYTSLAYDAVVLIAVVYDRLLSTGIASDDVTAANFMSEMDLLKNKDKSFDCLSGHVTFDENQDRVLSIVFQNFQPGKTTVTDVAALDPYGNIRWIVGETVVWTNNLSAVIVDPEMPPSWPSGAVTECNPGEAYSLETESCQVCPKGRSQEISNGRAVCQPCSYGLYNDVVGATECKPCEPGTAQRLLGQEKCNGCHLGEFSRYLAANCSTCAVGTFSRDRAAECTFCQVGKYAAIPGMSSCEACPWGLTTANIASRDLSSCVCPENYYMPSGGPAALLRGEQIECKACSEGLLCPVGSSEEMFEPGKVDTEWSTYHKPQILPGYWSSPESPLVMFRCAGTSRCLGPNPGDCGENLEGRSCAYCSDGYVWKGQACKKCSSLSAIGLTSLVVPIFLVPVAILLMYMISGGGFDGWISWKNCNTEMLFVILNYMQVLHLIRETDVDLPAGSQSRSEFLTFTNDFMDMFSIGCTLAKGFWTSLWFNMAVPAYMVCISGAIFLIVRRLKLTRFSIDGDTLICVVLSFFLTFFNSIARLACVVFKCIENPSGLLTMGADRGVICYSDQVWFDSLVLAIYGIVVHCVGFGSLLMWVLKVAPDRYSDPSFRSRWKFVFAKYRPDCHWWSLAFLAKSAFLNAGLVFIISGDKQNYWVFFVFSLFICGVCFFCPYRHIMTNVLEVAVCLATLAVTAVVLQFARVSERQDIFSMSTAAIVGACPVCLAVALLFWNTFCTRRWASYLRRPTMVHPPGSHRGLIQECVYACAVFLEARTEQTTKFHFGEHDHQIIRNFVKLVFSEVSDQKLSNFSGRRLVARRKHPIGTSLSTTVSSSNNILVAPNDLADAESDRAEALDAEPLPICRAHSGSETQVAAEMNLALPGQTLNDSDDVITESPKVWPSSQVWPSSHTEPAPSPTAVIVRYSPSRTIS
eukprot:TRINITY_DN5219_c0_g1_i1.p1 TRINITY_DN5219_c0_g1~~TRINITY_DN5219_c0_g1_i1.p1  ORF type:complete len:1299 (+),score=142.79 TRINITY_DN5219_c0_g1_i1:115-4011(+)